MRRPTVPAVLAACAAAVIAWTGVAGAATAAPSSSVAAPTGATVTAPAKPAAKTTTATYSHACSTAVPKGFAHCDALVRTDRGAKAVQPNALPAGLGPTDLQSAYKLPSSTAGSGQTVAIVDAQDDPNAESDLATYRSTYGLPACTTANGCFRKVNQNGAASPLPAADAGWAGEISLDVDMVSAICPNCHILLVEASGADTSNLFAAIGMAVSQGAKFVSNSWGGPEDGTEPTLDSVFANHPGVAFTASTGDDGTGASYPATSPYVTAVGGTSLVVAS